MNKKLSVIIADDHPFTLMGTKAYIESLGYIIMDLFSNGIHAYNTIITRSPDIALLDISMPGMNGLEILEKIQTHKVKTKIILLTMHKELSVFNRAKELNVQGYVLKEFATDVLQECMVSVLEGKRWFSKELFQKLQSGSEAQTEQEIDKLSTAEKKIATLIAQQYANKEIAEMLFVSERTIEGHRHNMIKKLNLPSEKNALMVWALKNMLEK